MSDPPGAGIGGNVGAGAGWAPEGSTHTPSPAPESRVLEAGGTALFDGTNTVWHIGQPTGSSPRPSGNWPVAPHFGQVAVSGIAAPKRAKGGPRTRESAGGAEALPKCSTHFGHRQGGSSLHRLDVLAPHEPAVGRRVVSNVQVRRFEPGRLLHPRFKSVVENATGQLRPLDRVGRLARCQELLDVGSQRFEERSPGRGREPEQRAHGFRLAVDAGGE